MNEATKRYEVEVVDMEGNESRYQFDRRDVALGAFLGFSLDDHALTVDVYDLKLNRTLAQYNIQGV